MRKKIRMLNRLFLGSLHIVNITCIAHTKVYSRGIELFMFRKKYTSAAYTLKNNNFLRTANIVKKKKKKKRIRIFGHRKGIFFLILREVWRVERWNTSGRKYVMNNNSLFAPFYFLLRGRYTIGRVVYELSERENGFTLIKTVLIHLFTFK